MATASVTLCATVIDIEGTEHRVDVPSHAVFGPRSYLLSVRMAFTHGVVTIFY